MVTQKFDLNMIPGKPKPIIRASQYDTGLRAFEVSIFAGTDTYTIPSGATLTVQGTKPDYTGFSYSATYSGNTVTFDCTDQMTACAGAVEMEIAVVNEGKRVATANFVLQVEPAALKDDTIISETDIPIIEQLPEMMEDVNTLISTFGGPNVAETAAEMTDQDKVYVYIGSETGYNSGHWYYYDKTAHVWKDGGIYQSAGVEVDNTLSIGGMAADAKATGDALALKADIASPTFTGDPKAPTASLISYNTQIANTEFVQRLVLPLDDAVNGLEPTEIEMHLVVDGTIGTWAQGGKTNIYDLLPGDNVEVTAGERDAYLVWYTTQGGSEAVNVSTSHTVTAGAIGRWGTTDARKLAVLMEDTSGNDVSPASFTINGVEKGLNERVDALETTKQDTLTFDTTPTEGSTNPVTSGGAWEAVQTDKTLAVEDKAADAKATGEKITELKNDFSNLATVTTSDGKFSSSVEYGAINGGQEATNTRRARTVDYLPIIGGKVILTLSSGYSAHIVGYDSNKEYVSDFGSWNTDGATITATGCSYIRFVFKNSAGTELTDSDITTLSGFYITETPAMLEELKAHDNVDDLKDEAQIYVISPNLAYIEETNTPNGSVYLHYDGNIAVRVITNVTKSISDLATEIGTTLVTSPKGVANCISIPTENSLVFNTANNKFAIVGRSSVTNTMIVLISCIGGKVVASVDSFIFDKMSAIETTDTDEDNYISASVDSVVSNMEGQNGNSLNLAFITDLHFTAFSDDITQQREIWERNSNGLSAVNKKRNLDFVILGGDYLWNNASSTLTRAKKAYSALQSIFYVHRNRQFALKGNHDDNSIAGESSYAITDSVRYGYLGQQYTDDVVIKYGTAEKSYGYIDFNRQKIRVFFINTVDIPESYSGQTVKAIGNEQLNFIADSLKFTDSGWGVIFFSHHALVNNSGINPLDNSDVFVPLNHGGNAVWGIIQAFKNKTTYSVSSTLTDFAYSVTVDYTGNASDEVIACINGHTHRDLSGQQNGVLLITTTASGFGVDAYDSNGELISRTAGTNTETSYDIFSINRLDNTIKASRYGAGQNRNWSF